MNLRALRGLRGRLLLALVGTSIVTLAITAAITLGPLQKRLRDQNVHAVQIAAEDLRADFSEDLSRSSPHKSTKQDGLDALEYQREGDLLNTASDLRKRVNARVLASDLGFTLPGSDNQLTPAFLADTDNGQSQDSALDIARRALIAQSTLVEVHDDNLSVAMPLYDSKGVSGIVVVEKPLTEVATAVHLVRNALLAAAGISLIVAVALALTLSSTLTRRLGRLRRSALRISAEGPEAPAPLDRGRDEVGDLARALARMQEELRRQETARRSFVATASHELRTPLTMLQGTMELLDEDLQEGLNVSDAREQVANARRELRRLGVLATELLDLSRLDAAVQLRSEPVELGELMRAVAAEFALRAAERHVELDAAPPQEPCWARADPAACARVVRILIDNALRYAPEGEPITITAGKTNGGRVAVEVSDLGPGVPEDEREQIFERFHRGRATSAETGFGLGLAIGRELAERMGGRLTLQESERGAHFRLMLPATSGTSGGSSSSRSPAPDSAAAA